MSAADLVQAGAALGWALKRIDGIWYAYGRGRDWVRLGDSKRAAVVLGGMLARATAGPRAQ